MKPPEILGMLEEAAGTRMYESKKEAALRTLDKKQVKVEEINKVHYRQLCRSRFTCKDLLILGLQSTCMLSLFSSTLHIITDTTKFCCVYGRVDILLE